MSYSDDDYGYDSSGDSQYVPSYANSPGDGGTVNASMPLTLPPDASGGNGSFLSQLLPTLTNGVSATVNSALLNSLGGQSSLYTVDAYGNLVPKAAAAANNSTYAAATTGIPPLKSVLQSPATLIVLALLAGVIIYAAVK